MQYPSTHHHHHPIILTISVLQKKPPSHIKNRPFGVFGQCMVQSSEIVGGIDHDFLRLWDADVDCIHYLRREITPVKYLRKSWEKKHIKRRQGEEKKAQLNSCILPASQPQW